MSKRAKIGNTVTKGMKDFMGMLKEVDGWETSTKKHKRSSKNSSNVVPMRLNPVIPYEVYLGFLCGNPEPNLVVEAFTGLDKVYQIWVSRNVYFQNQCLVYEFGVDCPKHEGLDPEFYEAKLQRVTEKAILEHNYALMVAPNFEVQQLVAVYLNGNRASIVIATNSSAIPYVRNLRLRIHQMHALGKRNSITR